MPASSSFLFDVFLSHSSKDQAAVRELAARLRKDGLRIWFDEWEIRPGDNIPSRIEDGLETSRVLLLCLSANALGSDWATLEGQAFRFRDPLNKERRFIPLRLDDTPIKGSLAQFSSISWLPDDSADSYARVLNACLHEPQALELRTSTVLPVVAPPKRADATPRTSFVDASFPRGDAIPNNAAWRGWTRRRLQHGVGSISILVLLACGVWTWDYNRLKVGDFANVGTRWGVPEGVGALDPENCRGRETHFRFEVRRHKIRRILRVNSAQELRDDAEDGERNPAIQVISYREDGTVQQIDLRDHNEKLVMRKTFSQPRTTDDGVVQYVDFHAEQNDEPFALRSWAAGLGIDNPLHFESASEITAHQILYDSTGRAARIIYLNAYRQHRPDREGLFGQRLVYEDSSLLPSNVQSLGPDGTPAPGWNGRIRMLITRNRLGDLIETRYLGIEGQAVPGSAGCHKQSFVRDVHGNLAELSCFGIDDEPAVYSGGFHKNKQLFDAHGNLTEWTHFGIDGRPTLDKDGVHNCKRRFDRRGNPIEWAYFGIDGRPTLSKDGIHKSTEVFDARNNVTERSYYGTDGKPTVNIESVHKVTASFDTRGNVIEEASFGVDGKPTVNKDGFQMTKSRFDARDNLTRRAFFGMDGKPTVNQYGFHRFIQDFDARGNCVEVTVFGPDGKPTVSTSGVHRVAWTFDVGGNLTGVAFFGIDRKPALIDGFHRFTFAFDERRNQSESAGFGIDNRPTLGKNGVHKYRSLYDSRGNVIEEASFGIDGRPAVCTCGFQKRTYVVDVLGNRIEQAVFGVDGAPAIDENGVHRVISRFDTRGNATEETFWGIDGKPTVNRFGAHKITRRFDSRGALIELAHFGLSEKPTFAISAIEFALGAMAGSEMRFTQRLTAKGLKQARVESGLVTFGHPPLMHWSYREPESKLFIFDGHTSWLYVERDREVTITHFSDAAMTAIPILLLADSAGLSANYMISQQKSGNVETTYLKTNKANVQIPEITVDRDARDGLMSRIEYFDREGNRTVFEFSGRRKVPTDATLFQFTPPKGVHVTSFSLGVQ